MPLIVHLHQLEKDDLKLQGELSSEELDLENLDELIHFRRPLVYDLELHKDQDNLLMQGTLRLTLDCECARCLKPYLHEIQLDKWVCLVPLAGEESVPVINDSVDLTPYLREDIVLALPQHPVCGPNCQGIRGHWRHSGKQEQEAGKKDLQSSPWNELDKLEFEN